MNELLPCVFIRRNVTLVTPKNAFSFQKNVVLWIFGRKCGKVGREIFSLWKIFPLFLCVRFRPLRSSSLLALASNLGSTIAHGVVGRVSNLAQGTNFSRDEQDFALLPKG